MRAEADRAEAQAPDSQAADSGQEARHNRVVLRVRVGCLDLVDIRRLAPSLLQSQIAVIRPSIGGGRALRKAEI